MNKSLVRMQEAVPIAVGLSDERSILDFHVVEERDGKVLIATWIRKDVYDERCRLAFGRLRGRNDAVTVNDIAAVDYYVDDNPGSFDPIDIVVDSPVIEAPRKRKAPEAAEEQREEQREPRLVGDRVEVYYPSNIGKEVLAGSYHPGVITFIRGDQVKVKLDRTGNNVAFTMSDLRTIRTASVGAPYQIGDYVDVFYPTVGNSWWQGRINSIGSDTYTIEYLKHKSDSRPFGRGSLRFTLPADI